MRGLEPELIEEAIKMAKESAAELEPGGPVEMFIYPSLCADYLLGRTSRTIVGKALDAFRRSIPEDKRRRWISRYCNLGISADFGNKEAIEKIRPMIEKAVRYYAQFRLKRYPELQAHMPNPAKRQRRTPVAPQEPRLSQSEIYDAIRYLDPDME
jgi:hypothetical protein